MSQKLFILFLFFLPLATLAYQPRLTVNQNYLEILKPETSQAFYGELKGQSAVYKIKSTTSFRLYLGLLVPALDNADQDFSARVYVKDELSNWQMIYFLDGLKMSWLKFYEGFTNDDYLRGPELKSEEALSDKLRGVEMAAGIYTIEVFSPDNLGRYVLVVGDQEELSVQEAIGALSILPAIKKDFFNKSPFSALFTWLAFYLLLLALAVLLPIMAIIILIFTIRKKRYLQNNL